LDRRVSPETGTAGMSKQALAGAAHAAHNAPMYRARRSLQPLVTPTTGNFNRRAFQPSTAAATDHRGAHPAETPGHTWGVLGYPIGRPGLEAWAQNRRGIRPACVANRPASTAERIAAPIRS